MAALVQWRRFMFFDKDMVKDGENTNVPHPGILNLSITASTSGRGHLVFGDAKGYIHFVDRSFTFFSFPAYLIRVTHLLQLKQSNILISVGNDEEGVNPVLKVWNRDKPDKSGFPTCVRTLKITHKDRCFAVSQIAACETHSQVAIGLYNGVVLLIRADLSRDRFVKTKPIHEGSDPITGLGFRQDRKAVTLFIITPNQVISIGTAGRDTFEVLFEQGADLKCCVMSDPDQDMVIGRTEAVYFYEADGQGPCYAFEGEKKQLAWFRSYLVVIGDAKGNTNKLNPVTIYDIENKFVAFSGAFTDVVDVLSEWGALYILCGDHKLYQLDEKDTQSKLEMLFKKNLYHHAIQLAQSQHYDRENINEIFTQYADHLYGKGDFDGAITQYARTIGYLEPSYVIRKFLDAQRIHNLTTYLQALHEKGQATTDHTTLLLNCYTKLKDVSRLDEFIMTDKEVNFDVETAIKVCRQAGYYKHALYLANKFAQHEWHLRIQLEDIKNYDEALNYIATLPFAEAERNVKDYGKELVNQLPERTTKLLMDLCTTYKPKRSAGSNALRVESSQDSEGSAEERAKPEEFIHIYVDQMKWLRQFLEHVVQRLPEVSPIVYNTLLELYLKDDDSDRLDPRAKEAQLKERQEKAMALLKNENAKYDIDHAMVLTQMFNFRRGILHLYEKAKLYQQMVQYFMEIEDYPQILNTCKKYGKQDPSLWVQVLSYFAGKERDCGKEISECLSYIDNNNLLPPLLVVQILGKNSTATLSVVKEFVASRIEKENNSIVEDEKTIRKYKEDTSRMRNEIESLKSSAKVFMNAKCSACASPLELPTVHFMCMHSYHARCLGDNEKECTLCAPENKKVLDIIRQQEQSAENHESFFKELDGAAEGFQVVANFFGRNLFGKSVLLTDAAPHMPTLSSYL